MIFVRNLRIPCTSGWTGHTYVLLMRHLHWAVGWTEISFDADAGWAAALLLNEPGGVSGFKVLASAPAIIEDQAAVGRFTSNMVGFPIFLKAVNEANCGMFRIMALIDAKHVMVDPQGYPPGGWIDESNMPGRVVSNNVTRLATPIGVLFQAPVGNLQVRFVHAYDGYGYMSVIYARPKGGAAIATEVGGYATSSRSGQTALRVNAVFSNQNSLVYYWCDNADFYLNLAGCLEDTDTGDSDPNFVWAGGFGVFAGTRALSMLNVSDVAISAYPTYLKELLGDDVAVCFDEQRNRRLQNGRPGKLLLHRARVVLDNIASNACIRGRFPLIRLAHAYLEKARPLDAPGQWLHTESGLVVPRNGPSDQLPLLL